MTDAVVEDRLAMVRAMSDGEIAELLGSLPFVAAGLVGRGPLVGAVPLLGGAREPDRRALAAALAHPTSIALALQGLPAAGVALAIVIAALGGEATDDDLDVEMAGLPVDERRATAASLVRHAIAARAGDRIALRPGVAAHLGRPGRPLADLLLDQSMTSDDIARRLTRLGVHPVPTRKGQRIDALREILGDRDRLAMLVELLDERARAMFERLAAAGGRGASCTQLGVNWWQVRIRYALPSAAGPAVDAMRRLDELGLVWLDEPMQQAGLWLDVLRAWHGRIVERWTPLPGDRTADAPVDEIVRTPAVLSAFHTLVRHASLEPIPGLKARGFGVKVVRDLAKRFGQRDAATGVLLRLGVALRVIEEQSQIVGSGRNASWQYRYLAPTAQAEQWAALDPVVQWERLVSAWLDGRDETGAGRVAPHVRRLIVADLAALPRGRAIPRAEFTAWCAERHVLAAHSDLDAVLDHLVALDLVGASGPVALGALARLVLDDPTAAAAALPAPTTQFVVQADHTIVAPDSLAPVVRALLDRLCTIESTGSVTVYRLDADRIAQELAAGQTADGLVEQLAAGSTVPLPPVVEQLFHDAERRRGGLTVAAAATVVTAADVLSLAAAVKVRAARLTLIAPTVATSDLPPAKVMAALRAKGLAPSQGDDASPATRRATPAAAPRSIGSAPSARRAARSAAAIAVQPGPATIATIAATIAGT